MLSLYILGIAKPTGWRPILIQSSGGYEFMRFDPWQSIRLLAGFFLLTICATSVLAQTHVVNQDDIHKELVGSSQKRQKNLEKVRGLFSSDETRKALESAQISPKKIDAAVATLNDEELARLASRADKLDRDFAAGRLNDRDLLIIIVG